MPIPITNLKQTSPWQKKFVSFQILIASLPLNIKSTPPDIYVGLARDFFFIRTLKFPLSVKENISQTLRYEMEKYVPIPLDAMYFDFIRYGESKNDNTLKVLLVVAKKENLDPFLELSRFIIPGIAGIEPIPIARMNGVNHLLGSNDVDGRALIHVGKNHLEIDYAQKGIIQIWSGVEGPGKDPKTLAERIGHELRTVTRTGEHDENRIDVVIDGTVDVTGFKPVPSSRVEFSGQSVKYRRQPNSFRGIRRSFWAGAERSSIGADVPESASG